MIQSCLWICIKSSFAHCNSALPLYYLQWQTNIPNSCIERSLIPNNIQLYSKYLKTLAVTTEKKVFFFIISRIVLRHHPSNWLMELMLSMTIVRSPKGVSQGFILEHSCNNLQTISGHELSYRIMLCQSFIIWNKLNCGLKLVHSVIVLFELKC